MQGMAAIKEGLFEGYYGTKHVSYAGKQTEARLMIKHNRTLGEDDARFRYVESLFVETADGERFRLPFTKLAGGRAMLEHVKQGGKPYDVRGQHIAQMVEQINVLGQFRRAHHGRILEGAAQELVTETEKYYTQLRRNLKTLESRNGYQHYFESWTPADINEQELVVEDIKELFVQQTIDPRVLKALPVLAQIKESNKLKEAEIFETWAESVVESNLRLPDSPQKLQQLKDFMSQEQIIGPDATNATEQLDGVLTDTELYDLLVKAAEKDPTTDAREIVTYWLNAKAESNPEVDQLRASLEPAPETPAAPQPEVSEADNLATFEDTANESNDSFGRLMSLALGK
jgi:hypothetical protein